MDPERHHHHRPRRHLLHADAAAAGRSASQLDAGRFVTHHFDLDQFDEAYDVFAGAADTGALKVVLTRT